MSSFAKLLWWLLLLLGDIAEKRYRLLLSILPFRSNGRRYRHDFFCIRQRQPHVSPRSCGLHRPTIFSPLPQSNPYALSVDLSIADIRWQMRPNGIHECWPLRPPISPKLGSIMNPIGPRSRRVLQPGEYDKKISTTFLLHTSGSRRTPVNATTATHDHRVVISTRMLDGCRRRQRHVMSRL